MYKHLNWCFNNLKRVSKNVKMSMAEKWKWFIMEWPIANFLLQKMVVVFIFHLKSLLKCLQYTLRSKGSNYSLYFWKVWWHVIINEKTDLCSFFVPVRILIIRVKIETCHKLMLHFIRLVYVFRCKEEANQIHINSALNRQNTSKETLI